MLKFDMKELKKKRGGGEKKGDFIYNMKKLDEHFMYKNQQKT